MEDLSYNFIYFATTICNHFYIHNYTSIMYHNSDKIIILYVLCTIQLQPYLLTMVSKQSANTTTSTMAEQDSMPSQQSTAHGKKVRCDSHLIYTQSCPYICCPEICDRCSRNYISHTSLQENVHCRSIQEMQ